MLRVHRPLPAGTERRETDGPRPTGLIGRALVAWTRVCLRLPLAVVLLATLSAVAAGLWSSQQLGYKVSRVDLLDPDSEYNKLWIDYLREFGEEDDAVIVVEGTSRAGVIGVLGELSREVSRQPGLFRSVLHEVDLSRIRSKGLHYVMPADLERIEAFLERAEPVIQGGWGQLKVGTMVAGLAAEMVGGARRPGSGDEPPLAALERYAEALLAAVETPDTPGAAADYLSPWPGMPDSLATLRDLSSEHLLAKDGRLGFVLLRLVKQDGGFAGASAATDELRRIIAAAGDRHAGISIGLTGLPVMEDDEMRTSQQSMLWASGLSLVAVAVVIAAGFGGFRHALMANGVLVIGMAWAFAWATASVGHLNILSVTFTVTMIGVGIDYGTYYVGRYLEARRRRDPAVLHRRALHPAGGAGARGPRPPGPAAARARAGACLAATGLPAPADGRPGGPGLHARHARRAARARLRPQPAQHAGRRAGERGRRKEAARGVRPERVVRAVDRRLAGGPHRAEAAARGAADRRTGGRDRLAAARG
jgi:hypothetical protein